MTVVSKNFATLVSDQVTAIQGAATKLVDLTIGSILRAVVEANAAVVLWLQGLVLTLLAKTRAATSNGSDLDTWVADFGLTRLAAVAASGSVTFARFTPTNAATVPIGSLVQTGDGTQKYAVTIDVTNPAYSSGAGGYVIGAGVSSVTVPVLGPLAGQVVVKLATPLTDVRTPPEAVIVVPSAFTMPNVLADPSEIAGAASERIYVEAEPLMAVEPAVAVGLPGVPPLPAEPPVPIYCAEADEARPRARPKVSTPRQTLANLELRSIESISSSSGNVNLANERNTVGIATVVCEACSKLNRVSQRASSSS